MNKNQKLELTWYGKDDVLKIEPRILIENKELSNTSQDEKTENMLIHGDNLLALKALEQNYAGIIKCIYIDPPYNTGSAFDNYDDNLEHSTWLSLMRPRLEILRNLLAEDGSIFISIDDREYAYLKILCDEIFLRCNYVGDFIWQKKRGGGNDSKFIAVEHEYVICYVKNIEKAKNWHVGYDKDYLKRYREEDEEGRYFWDTLARPGLKNPIIYEVIAPDGSKIKNGWVCSKEKFNDNLSKGKIRFLKKKDGTWSIQFKQYLGEGKKPRSILSDVAINSDAKKEMQQIFGDAKFFAYPKPENLIRCFIEIATKPNDLVLDSFLGSGTTSAVAHKMNRKWIGIEMGEQAYSHCKVRLDKVISNEVNCGITESVNWQGGGGYKFYELAPTLIKEDAFGQSIINPEYNAEMLASAVAKHEGYFYEPDGQLFWKQSNNKGKSYLYVTTNHVTNQIIDSIKADMQDDEFVLIVCKSYDQSCVSNKNIAIKKIPQSLLRNCEFGKDDYSLNIVCPPEYEEDDFNE